MENLNIIERIKDDKKVNFDLNHLKIQHIHSTITF